MQALIDAAPRSRRDLDHVPATAETAVRRAEWMATQLYLDGQTLLFLGDHDLTALAAAPRLPATRIVVVDIDDSLLDFISATAAQQEMTIACLHADLSITLPDALAGVAHFVFTDPPYTPDGVQLFLARAVQALDASPACRIGLAYGFAHTHPALGVDVQRRILELGLAIESIERGFHAYTGAQAIGSRSDLYQLAPTPAARRMAARAAASAGQAVYTHGSRSLESSRRSLTTTSLAALAAAAGIEALAPDGGTVIGWSATGSTVEQIESPRRVFELAGARSTTALAASLLDGDESWLARLLLAGTAPTLALLVRNSHPDIASQSAQSALAELVADAYRLRFLRSHPAPSQAIVVAEATDMRTHGLLARPRTALRHALADALYKQSRQRSKPWPKDRTLSAATEIVERLGGASGSMPVSSLPRRTLLEARQAVTDALGGESS